MKIFGEKKTCYYVYHVKFKILACHSVFPLFKRRLQFPYVFDKKANFSKDLERATCCEMSRIRI